ncbi:MAG: dihydrofolate reductase family protein [Verrucomicrobia bacterium]|nr:dihydrofolate reductase family protein [Verrucomicrobiota bacterium]
MRRLVVITHLTLDGVMQAPGGPDEDRRNGFPHGGWAMAHGDAVSREAMEKLMAADFDLLLGRRTYEIFAPYWPHHDDNFIGRAFNRATKHVATRTLTHFEWAKSRRLGDDVVAAVRELKASAGPTLHVWGSGELLQTLMAAHLVDEYQLWIRPIILGQGRRLFENGLPATGLTLVESRPTTTGVLLNTYRPTSPFNRSARP